MKIKTSNATFSSIVGIGQKVKRASKESGEQYLELNRGVNAVTNIDISEIVNKIDFNSKELQVYAPNLGLESLRKEIVKQYFNSNATTPNFIDNIAITPGGMPALDLVFQILNIDKIYFPNLYWGSYSKIATIRNKSYSFYESMSHISKLVDDGEITNSSCVVICDPNNPTGVKEYDDIIIGTIKKLSTKGVTVIVDCPYRKLFFDGYFFDEISHYQNVIITESFSKWIGLSGLRLGFIFCKNKEFNDELNIRLLYEFNGVSTSSQLIVSNILGTELGLKSVNDFRLQTTKNISNNIDFLYDNNLLLEKVYNYRKPLGIFAVINKSEDFLFNHKIGAVGMDKFTYHDKDYWSSYSRICVSVEHELFKRFMINVVE